MCHLHSRVGSQSAFDFRDELNDWLNRLMAFIDGDVICINRLSELGQQVGSRVLDVLVLREKGMKREVRVLNILLFVKSVLWKVIFMTI